MDKGERVCIYRNLIALFEALAFLHHSSDEMFVIHRDIKPHNILIFGEYFKISDFGHSRVKDFDETSKTEWLAGLSNIYYDANSLSSGTEKLTNFF
jgi:serine/threonine protein kinase